MRILVEGGSSGSGGYLHHLRGVLTATPPADVEVTLLCSPRLAERLGPLGAHVRLVTPRVLDAPGALARRRWWLTEFPGLVRGHRPDVLLHAHGLVRGGAGRVPRAVIHHNIAPFTAETYRLYGVSVDAARILVTRQRLATGMRRADGVAFVHEYCRDVIRHQVRGIRATGVTGNATPAEFLSLPVAARAELPAAPRVLCVSTQHLSKYLWNVVHAVCDARAATGLDLRLDLVGGGDAATARRVAAVVRQRGAAGFVTSHAGVPAARMPEIYAGGDVLVFPSAQETCPITLLEAMAAGLPIACSNRMMMPDLLRDAGVYFDPADPASLVTALRVLLADGDLRVRAGALAQVYARQHTWQESADRLFAFLWTLADASAARSAPALPAQRRPGLSRPVLGRRP